MTRPAALLAAVFALLWLAGGAVAQTEPKKSPLGLPLPATAQSQPQPVAEPGVLDRAWFWVLGQQERFKRQMSGAIRDLKAGGGIHAAWVLSLIAFIYGVLHAAGPGHGKFVISSYVLANDRTLRRGILLSFLAALFQAISAVAIVGVMAIALNATSMAIKSAEHWIETASWALVAAVGAWMLYGQVQRLMAKPAKAAATAGPVRHEHMHLGHAHHDPHAHDGTCCGGHHHEAHEHRAHEHGTACNHRHGHHSHGANTHHAHGEGHGHDHSACCGHAHMPSPKDLEGDLTWGKAFALAGSVGIRPCSGAVILLIFALSQGLLWAGVLATFAMALGTAITTSALAALAVGSKELATRFAGEDSRWATRIATAAGLTGATLVMIMGLAFFFASLNGPAPF